MAAREGAAFGQEQGTPCVIMVIVVLVTWWWCHYDHCGVGASISVSDRGDHDHGGGTGYTGGAAFGQK